VMNLVSLLIATSVVKYSSNVGLRTGVALGAVIVVVAAIVVSKRRSAGMGEEAPAAAEVTGAISPAVEGADTPAVESAGAVPNVTKATVGDDAEDRATAAKRTE
jgi:hypothetical protein